MLLNLKNMVNKPINKPKPGITLVFTGDGKGKTSAALGLMARALGADKKVAFFQFIKDWSVSEHQFIKKIQTIYTNELYFYKGGAGFYKAGKFSSEASETEHKKNARQTYDLALKAVMSGKYDLVICDEINNTAHDGLLSVDSLKEIIKNRPPKTSLCLTGRNFPDNLLGLVDIATNMTKLKHHYDDGELALVGIDY